MCGILGFVGRFGDLDLQAWGQQTAHRGPDAFGIWAGDGVTLGHNRLSIIDLSSAANQPMHSDDGGLSIVFNGEIFNYRELREELVARGSVFRTQSDTEVLLEGYRRWGPDVLQRLDGMFAFAIWDAASRELFVARDHIGIKPFFYRRLRGGLIFGSELKLLQNPAFGPMTIRRASVFEYLTYTYIPAPFTIYEEAFKLEPGHWLRFRASDEKLDLGRWWEVPQPSASPTTDVATALEQLREVFGQAVRRRMISDVPLGAFLSGGIDSSVIVAEMAATGGQVKTFSIGYRDNPSYDETEHAVAVARHLGVEHETLYPAFEESDIDVYLDLVIRHFDEPYGNPTVAMVHLLTAAARNRVTVALVGDGGDELFGGYPRHRALLLANKYRNVTKPFAPAALAALRLLPETPGRHHLIRRARQFFEAAGKEPGNAFQDWSTAFQQKDLMRHSVFAPNEVSNFRGQFISSWFNAGRGDDLGNALYADLNSFVPYNLLEGADRMSMANGFELRVPYVARGMIELAAGLASSLKIRDGVQKYLLKEAYRDRLPSHILRRPKRGFNPPVWHWLQANEGHVRRSLGDGRLTDYLQSRYLAQTVDSFYARTADTSLQVWMLLVLRKWLAHHDAAN